MGSAVSGQFGGGGGCGVHGATGSPLGGRGISKLAAPRGFLSTLFLSCVPDSASLLGPIGVSEVVNMSLDKMHDEKFENQSGSERLEAGFGEDGKAAKTLLMKMDVRYV